MFRIYLSVGQIISHPSESVPLVIQGVYDCDGSVPPPYFDEARGIKVHPCHATKRTFHASEVAGLPDFPGKSDVQKWADEYLESKKTNNP